MDNPKGKRFVYFEEPKSPHILAPRYPVMELSGGDDIYVRKEPTENEKKERRHHNVQIYHQEGSGMTAHAVGVEEPAIELNRHQTQGRIPRDQAHKLFKQPTDNEMKEREQAHQYVYRQWDQQIGHKIARDMILKFHDIPEPIPKSLIPKSVWKSPEEEFQEKQENDGVEKSKVAKKWFGDWVDEKHAERDNKEKGRRANQERGEGRKEEVGEDKPQTPEKSDTLRRMDYLIDGWIHERKAEKDKNGKEEKHEPGYNAYPGTPYGSSSKPISMPQSIEEQRIHEQNSLWKKTDPEGYNRAKQVLLENMRRNFPDAVQVYADHDTLMFNIPNLNSQMNIGDFVTEKTKKFKFESLIINPFNTTFLTKKKYIPIRYNGDDNKNMGGHLNHGDPLKPKYLMGLGSWDGDMYGISSQFEKYIKTDLSRGMHFTFDAIPDVSISDYNRNDYSIDFSNLRQKWNQMWRPLDIFDSLRCISFEMHNSFKSYVRTLLREMCIKGLFAVFCFDRFSNNIFGKLTNRIADTPTTRNMYVSPEVTFSIYSIVKVKKRVIRQKSLGASSFDTDNWYDVTTRKYNLFQICYFDYVKTVFPESLYLSYHARSEIDAFKKETTFEIIEDLDIKQRDDYHKMQRKIYACPSAFLLYIILDYKPFLN